MGAASHPTATGAVSVVPAGGEAGEGVPEVGKECGGGRGHGIASPGGMMEDGLPHIPPQPLA